MSRYWSLVVVLVCLTVVGSAQCESGSLPTKKIRTVRVVGRGAVLVTSRTIKLNDIAEVVSADPKDDEALLALQKIEIDPSPLPGKKLSVTASRVLERLTQAGVDLSDISYSLPRVMTVERAGRTLTVPEILAAIDQSLKVRGNDVLVKGVNYSDDIVLAPGETAVEALPYLGTTSGKMGFNITATVTDEAPVRFTVEAAVDEWREVPVARRALSKGSVVTDDDVMLARLNTSSLPVDAARETKGIVGLETNRPIGYGEVFVRQKLIVPPIITQGSKVVMRYQSKFFEATATGIALEAGAMGQQIRIKNDNSKKILTGTILEPGLVGITQ